ncbi:hypothetical protein PR202_gb21081 [Eleusine coracana subsp. coracana]|uniref:Gnk2-homologous domain-containing protein n=1 Tax=Eleusine coracana subsp. coracana TaxID=191504 RepID=A0AAV5FC58_ELECO|nr:hypothetical protein PR202_gb21081 [Eleusine coracana subsp. coracana]
MVPAAALLVLVALFPALAAVPADDRRWPAIDDSPVALSPGHICGEHGSYAPGSAYEASMQLLAATIPAKVNADSCNCSNGNTAGDSPDRVVASAFCPWRPGANSSDCGACVALAFREAQRLCPYQRQADVVVDGGACSLNFHDYDRREQEVSMAEPRARAVTTFLSPEISSWATSCHWMVNKNAPILGYEKRNADNLYFRNERIAPAQEFSQLPLRRRTAFASVTGHRHALLQSFSPPLQCAVPFARLCPCLRSVPRRLHGSESPPTRVATPRCLRLQSPSRPGSDEQSISHRAWQLRCPTVAAVVLPYFTR